MIRIHLNDNELEKAQEILKNRFELSLMYPNRKVFHISEFVAFYEMIVRYHIARGALDAAQSALNVFKKVAPDHPELGVLQQVLMIGNLKEYLAQLSAPKKRNKQGKKRK
jgi:hypothetical protein